MQGINRAIDNQYFEKALRELESIKNEKVPCIFISYQRKDQDYAEEVANYIMSKQIDVYFDLEDKDLKFYNQNNDPKDITQAIQNGLDESDYMIVVISPDTYRSLWVPFEIGYSYKKMKENLKLLRHKDIDKASLPGYLKVREMLNGAGSLNRFLKSIQKNYRLYENLIEKGEKVKVFSDYKSNPLRRYLDNE